MRDARHGIWRTFSRLAAGLVLAGTAVGCGASPPGKAGGRAAPPFQAARAFADLERQVGFGPRIPGTAGHRATREWLVATLRPLADEVQEDHFEAAGLALTNVIARFDPGNDQRVLLCAHWDTRPHADHDPDPTRRRQPVPGANDGASGTAVLIELARLFHDQPPAIGVDLVFFDGEDYGTFEASLREVLLGSQRYARTFSGPLPRYGILLDMVGDRDLRIPRELNSLQCCRRLMERVWSIAAELGHEDVFVPMAGQGILDDHIPLNRKGLGVIDLIDLDYGPWHTTADTPDAVSAESLGVVGAVVAEVVYREAP